MPAEKFTNPEFLREFIELYRALPCLWKVKSGDYMNKMKREKAYEELANLCKSVCPKADVQFVKTKISNELARDSRSNFSSHVESELTQASQSEDVTAVQAHDITAKQVLEEQGDHTEHMSQPFCLFLPFGFCVLTANKPTITFIIIMSLPAITYGYTPGLPPYPLPLEWLSSVTGVPRCERYRMTQPNCRKPLGKPSMPSDSVVKLQLPWDGEDKAEDAIHFTDDVWQDFVSDDDWEDSVFDEDWEDLDSDEDELQTAIWPVSDRPLPVFRPLSPPQPSAPVAAAKPRSPSFPLRPEPQFISFSTVSQHPLQPPAPVPALQSPAPVPALQSPAPVPALQSPAPVPALQSPAPVPAAAQSVPVSVPAAQSVPVSVPAAQTVPVSVPAAQTVPVSVPAAQPVPVSVPAAQTVPVSVPAAQPVPVSVPATQPVPVSVPTAQPDSIPVPAPRRLLLPEPVSVLFALASGPEDLLPNTDGQEDRTSQKMPKGRKRKNKVNYEESTQKLINKAAALLHKPSDEFDAFGFATASKLRRMDEEQRLFAESIITEALQRGLRKKLNDTTRCMDNPYESTNNSNWFPPHQFPQHIHRMSTPNSVVTYDQQTAWPSMVSPIPTNNGFNNNVSISEQEQPQYSHL
ncbi:hypothetical protein XELAEV_18016749mg [Xenopus laevis]|uniref:MADF domain-containing protein n=1 Tax=Xenopus laevis TaxID=8355 RepID=A0A974DB54_XENLA|nr:hypothetical protein XELAEV_18016749mg [Xenopus laevis]